MTLKGVKIMSNPYAHLLSPIKIGRLVARNRFMLAPMSYYAVDGEFCDEWLDFVEAVAKGGCGIVTVGESNLTFKNGVTHATNVVIDDPRCVKTLYRMAERIHKHGALASIELSHGGIVANPAFNNGQAPLGPCEVPVGGDFLLGAGAPVIPMTEEMMSEVADDYAKCVAICRDNGFDLVQIHMGHGWLLHQFLSSLYNHRTDEYGGSIENRVRFPLMVLKRIRERVGNSIALDIRISGSEVLDGGNTPEDVSKMIELMQDYIDMASISCGGIYNPGCTERMSPSVFIPRGVNIPIAEIIKNNKNIRIPISIVGALADPDMMEDIIASGKSDLVTMGRGFICDPEMPNKIRSGSDKEVLHCIRCYTCQESVFEQPYRRMHCAVNPRVGFEKECALFDLPAKTSKKLLVIGGGPAGMEAALTASAKGHKVILCEKEDHLGGALLFSDYIDFKNDIKVFKDSMIARVMSDPNIEVRLNTTVTPDDVKAINPDAAFAAIGAVPIAAPIKGLKENGFIFGADMFGREDEIGQNVVIIGGGLIGCENAVHLAQTGRKVTIVEMTDDISRDATSSHKRAVERMMDTLGVKVYLNTNCTEVKDNVVYALQKHVEAPVNEKEGLIAASGSAGMKKKFVVADSGKDAMIELKADTVMVATGMSAKTDEAWALRGDMTYFNVIGDCKKPGKIYDATFTAFFAAQNL